MISRGAGWLLERGASRRRRTLERVDRRAAAVQEATLLRLVTRARRTHFGLAHGFDGIRSVADYQRQVPLRQYLDFRPLWQRAIDGESDVTWPGRPRHWVKTSGTTAGEKYIPVTAEAPRVAPQGRVGRARPRRRARRRREPPGGPDAVSRRQRDPRGARRALRGLRSLRARRAPSPAGDPEPLLPRRLDRRDPRLGRAGRRGRRPRGGPGPAPAVRDALVAPHPV